MTQVPDFVYNTLPSLLQREMLPPIRVFVTQSLASCLVGCLVVSVVTVITQPTRQCFTDVHVDTQEAVQNQTASLILVHFGNALTYLLLT